MVAERERPWPVWIGFDTTASAPTSSAQASVALARPVTTTTGTALARA